MSIDSRHFPLVIAGQTVAPRFELIIFILILSCRFPPP